MKTMPYKYSDAYGEYGTDEEPEREETDRTQADSPGHAPTAPQGPKAYSPPPEAPKPFAQLQGEGLARPPMPVPDRGPDASPGYAPAPPIAPPPMVAPVGAAYTALGMENQIQSDAGLYGPATVGGDGGPSDKGAFAGPVPQLTNPWGTGGGVGAYAPTGPAGSVSAGMNPDMGGLQADPLLPSESPGYAPGTRTLGGKEGFDAKLPGAVPIPPPGVAGFQSFGGGPAGLQGFGAGPAPSVAGSGAPPVGPGPSAAPTTSAPKGYEWMDALANDPSRAKELAQSKLNEASAEKERAGMGAWVDKYIADPTLNNRLGSLGPEYEAAVLGRKLGVNGDYIPTGQLDKFRELAAGPGGTEKAKKLLDELWAGPAGVNPNGVPNRAAGAGVPDPLQAKPKPPAPLPNQPAPLTSFQAGGANYIPGQAAMGTTGAAPGTSGGIGNQAGPAPAGSTITSTVPGATGGAGGGSGSGGLAGGGQDDILQMLLGGANAPGAYGTDQVKDSYNWLGGQIDDDFALKQGQLDDEAASRGLGVSSIKSGRLKDLNIGRRSAKEGLARDLADKQASQGNQAQQNKLGWLQSLMGYGQQGFNNDLATANFNENQNQNYQDWLLKMLGMGYGGAGA